MLLLVFMYLVCLFSLYLLNYSFRLYRSFVRACITYLDDSPLHLYYYCHLNEKKTLFIYIQLRQSRVCIVRKNWGKKDFEKSQGKSENFFCGLQKYVFPSLSQGIFKILKQLLSFLYILHLLLQDTLDRVLLRSQ